MAENKKWDGIPRNAKKSGFHFLKNIGSESAAPCFWNSKEQTWILWNDVGPNPVCSPQQVAESIEYLGICGKILSQKEARALTRTYLDEVSHRAVIGGVKRKSR